ELVAYDVRALTGKDRSSRGRTMEELQALAVVKGVEVDAEIEIHGQYGADFPGGSRQQCSPEIGAAAQGFGGGPVAKICSSGRMRLGLRSRGRVDNSDRERLLSQNGHWPLNDLASARLSTVAGILLPSIDHALRPGFRGRRARLASALAFRGRRLRCVFRSLPCHLVSPIHEPQTSTPGEKAVTGLAGGFTIMVHSVAIRRKINQSSSAKHGEPPPAIAVCNGDDAE